MICRLGSCSLCADVWLIELADGTKRCRAHYQASKAPNGAENGDRPSRRVARSQESPTYGRAVRPGDSASSVSPALVTSPSAVSPPSGRVEGGVSWAGEPVACADLPRGGDRQAPTGAPSPAQHRR